LRESALIASLSQPPVHVLIAGESWIRRTIHMKGFDQFHATEYEEGGGAVLEALANSGVAVTYIRAHEISARFPKKAEELDRFDTVVARQGEDSIFVAGAGARRPYCRTSRRTGRRRSSSDGPTTVSCSCR
jgi:hypothetical protein